MIFQHVCICRDMLGLTNLVLRMWKLSVRLFSKQPGRSRIIIQLIVSFFLKCSKTAGQTTPPPAQKKRNQVDTGIVRSVFQGRRWVEFVLVLHRHSYTTNLPKSACRCPQEGGGWSEGREGLDSSNSLSQAEMHKKKVKSYRLFDFLCCVDNSGTDIHLVYIHTSEADRTERTGKLINTS